MARREYTQTVKPVSRIPEKIFGWLGWLSLLGLLGLGLYSLLVSGNDPNFMNEMERQLSENPQLSDFRDLMAQNNMTVPEFVSYIMKIAWGIMAYLALPLILGLIGLLSMKKRILAGVMLLLAGLLTAPLFVTIALFWIPLFFFIAAILLFARKDKVIRNEDYYHDHETVSYDREREAAPVYVDRDADIERDRYNDIDRTEREGVYVDRTEEVERPQETVVTEERTVETTPVDTDDTVTYHRSEGDRVKYVDKTVDATEERRQNYNNRMNNND
ncbi:DUF4064 domain-containing protein [Macrococcus brunensis]|uniref:DUF4064 domain-containing protein n=1 Tax=Macrococcus brunensis TaxID=198483 RepID=A0A4V3BDK7_9STAP|nr:DUF4064 domain-containing protein [Macrococcus brunensis]TDL98816.1 DUF4064 domain-containing protein [Macrococcus brunensis]ULG72756.1 DUF4064 domain-containing protein [Macrococcus brunensis]ULG75005.1 DUF4064 domain-containing protein [Macrococcus brunensis]